MTGTPLFFLLRNRSRGKRNKKKRRISAAGTLFLHNRTKDKVQNTCGKAEQEEWRKWLNEHGRRLLFCARQWTSSQAEAEDVLQDAFVRYWKNQRHLPGNPNALILTSVRRAAIDHGRSRTRRVNRETQAYELEDKVSFFEPGEGEIHESLEKAVRALPAEQREVVVMKIWGKLTFEEIARQLGISPNTAASRYRYALAALRKTVER